MYLLSSLTGQLMLDNKISGHATNKLKFSEFPQFAKFAKLSNIPLNLVQNKCLEIHLQCSIAANSAI